MWAGSIVRKQGWDIGGIPIKETDYVTTEDDSNIWQLASGWMERSRWKERGRITWGSASWENHRFRSLYSLLLTCEVKLSECWCGCSTAAQKTFSNYSGGQNNKTETNNSVSGVTKEYFDNPSTEIVSSMLTITVDNGAMKKNEPLNWQKILSTHNI